MRHRRLGRTGLELSEVTLGTMGLASPETDRAEAAATVALALDRGVTGFEIDAGDRGAAELLGEVFAREGAARRVHVFARITPLVRFDLPSPHVLVQQAYPGSHIRGQTEALLATLGIERLALQQLHAWCPEWLREGDWLETMMRLRAEGKIAGCGVSLFDHDVDAPLEAVASGAIDAVQAMLNVFDQGAIPALLPLCIAHDVGVIARSPLYYGALAGAAPRSDYFYDAHRRETARRVDRLAREIALPGETAADLALRFALSHPAVTTVAVGARSRAHLAADLHAFEQGPLEPARCAALAAHRWLC